VNWGCGLVVAGLLAREIAKRITIDFGWLVAGAYSGWIIWASGLSSSIAVQGPFAVPAAAQLHTSQAATAMAVAMVVSRDNSRLAAPSRDRARTPRQEGNSGTSRIRFFTCKCN
jgi:short subunit fatty acids transporter